MHLPRYNFSQATNPFTFFCPLNKKIPCKVSDLAPHQLLMFSLHLNKPIANPTFAHRQLLLTNFPHNPPLPDIRRILYSSSSGRMIRQHPLSTSPQPLLLTNFPHNPPTSTSNQIEPLPPNLSSPINNQQTPHHLTQALESFKNFFLWLWSFFTSVFKRP